MADGAGRVSPAEIGAVLAALAPRFGERLSTNKTLCLQHGTDQSYHPPMAPDAVVFAESAEEVSFIVRQCAERRVPVVPFGAGSSLEGHLAAVRGGLSVDLSRMNRVLRLNAEDLDVTVEAGVTRKQLNEHLRDTGLFFPVDPGADATLGGMAATGASGTTTVRYGSMRQNVLSLQVVLPSGEIIRTRSRARKSSAGYDLTHLMIGSEGTLGLITEVTLRLYGIPEAELTAVCPFTDFEGAVQTVIETIQLGIPVARIEFLDEVASAGIGAYAKLALAPSPTLFLDFHGTPAAVAEAAENFQAIAREHGLLGFKSATSAEERAKLWEARHGALWASLAAAPGKRPVITDVCVPISRLADCIAETRADFSAHGISSGIIGHVGDGNFHSLIMMNPDDPADVAKAKAAAERMVLRAIEMGGTATGEHGVGLGKMAFLEKELGAGPVGVMAAIKRAIDPLNIMNPGKIVRV